MTSPKHDVETIKKDRSSSKKSEHRLFSKRDELQNLTRRGTDILKKTMASGMEVIKEVKGNLPKEATQLIAKGKEELLKGLSQEMARNLIAFSVEKMFSIIRQHRFEVSFRLVKNEETLKEEPNEETETQKRKKR